MVCKTCKFFRRLKVNGKVGEYGKCAFNPPIPVIRREFNPHHQMYEDHEENIRPTVSLADACGRYTIGDSI